VLRWRTSREMIVEMSVRTAGIEIIDYAGIEIIDYAGVGEHTTLIVRTKRKSLVVWKRRPCRQVFLRDGKKERGRRPHPSCILLRDRFRRCHVVDNLLVKLG